MARHRNIRTRTFSEELDDYDDQYGKSLEEDFSISPGTAHQYLYDHRNFGRRDSNPPIHETKDEKTSEEDETDADGTNIFVADEDLKKSELQSSIFFIKDFVGNTKTENEIIDALNKTNLDAELALDILLNQQNPSTGQDNSTLVPGGGVDKKVSVSKLYKALTIEYNSVDYNRYEISKFIKEFINRSLKQNRLILNKFKDPVKTSKPAAPTIVKDTCDIENDKKLKKLTTKLIVEPEKSAPPSPSVKIKNIKQKSADEIRKLYEKKRINNKLQLNLVIAGHVDAGKSTIMGHLLSLLGNVSKKILHKNETEAKKAGKASFAYAWILDETEQERNRGITIDVGQRRFETTNRIVNILDAPGHRDFIPNMITGATKADVAMLVVDATNGEFESGFESGGQTQEHILLLRSFAITQVAIAINKMDNVDFNQGRFDEIVEKLKKFLKQVGYKENSVNYIPCSGMTGDNLVKLSANPKLKWYTGPTLIEIIDDFTPSTRPIDKPFRMSISDLFKGQTSGLYLSGKIDYGYVELNQKLLIVPNNEYCTVKNILIEDENQPDAFAGDVVSLNIPIVEGLEISIGNVLCDISSSCSLASKFEARIMTFGTLETPIINGTSVLIYSACLNNEIASISKLCSLLDKNKNEVIKKNPRLIGRNQVAIVQIKTTRPICVETFETYKDYGRFVFRSEHFTLGTGIVTKILC